MKHYTLKRLLTLLFIAAGMFYLTNCQSINPVEDEIFPEYSFNQNEKELVLSSSNFGIDLFKLLAEKSEGSNVIISPLSISTAFGMALNGASGATLEQMKGTLGFSNLDLPGINQSAKRILSALPSFDLSVTFKCANSIWHDLNFDVETNFTDINREYYNAEVNSADFGNPAALNQINNWVKRATNDKIEKIITFINPDVVMYLINAIYFKAPWKYMFDKTKTMDMPFKLTPTNSVACPFMIQQNNYSYFRNSLYQAAELPYGNNSYSMLLLLPAEGKTITDLVQNFSSQEFENLKSGLKETELTIYLPKFKLEYWETLNDYLITMGMKDAFIPGKADFRYITKKNDIFISEVKHKTFIEVNEEGTEAAGVTSIGYSRTSIDESLFNLNRPFLFLIYEKKSNSILFIGRINNPLEVKQ